MSNLILRKKVIRETRRYLTLLVCLHKAGAWVIKDCHTGRVESIAREMRKCRDLITMMMLWGV